MSFLGIHNGRIFLMFLRGSHSRGYFDIWYRLALAWCLLLWVFVPAFEESDGIFVLGWFFLQTIFDFSTSHFDECMLNQLKGIVVLSSTLKVISPG